MRRARSQFRCGQRVSRMLVNDPSGGTSTAREEQDQDARSRWRRGPAGSRNPLGSKTVRRRTGGWGTKRDDRRKMGAPKAARVAAASRAFISSERVHGAPTTPKGVGWRNDWDPTAPSPRWHRGKRASLAKDGEGKKEKNRKRKQRELGSTKVDRADKPGGQASGRVDAPSASRV